MTERSRTLVLATGNAGKLRELGDMLHPHGWVVRSQAEWNVGQAAEDGLTFFDNALSKARHAAAHTGLPALGDDSGLLVDALDGAPGLHSSRYAGVPGDDEANKAKLLEALHGVPPERRTAHFFCALVLVRHAADPAPLISFGRWRGSILNAPRGTGGFGYDPLFWVPPENCASAELEPALKNRISHRGQALAQMVGQIAYVLDA
jgi:XTP/dITP diphosphohydrolase